MARKESLVEPAKSRGPRKKQEGPKGAKPAETPEAREKQLVNLAVSLAEKQLHDGTAAPSIINHYLKIASTRETIERELLEKQKALMEAKAKSIAETKDNEKLAKAAIDAMKNYSGTK